MAEDIYPLIEISSFIGQFGSRGVPNGYIGSQRAYPPGFDRTSRTRWWCRYNLEGLYYRVDYINGQLVKLEYWLHPKQCVAQEINQLTYRIIPKLGGIKKIQAKIDIQEHRLQQILFSAEKELLYLKHVWKGIGQDLGGMQGDLRNRVKIEHATTMLDGIQERFNECYHHYSVLSQYFFRLGMMRIKYNRLTDAVKTRKKCYQCFTDGGEGGLTQKKNRMWCGKCLRREEQKNSDGNVELECPVCYDPFKKRDMIEVNCANGHWVCGRCYGLLRLYGADCPMCRGPL